MLYWWIEYRTAERSSEWSYYEKADFDNEGFIETIIVPTSWEVDKKCAI